MRQFFNRWHCIHYVESLYIIVCWSYVIAWALTPRSELYKAFQTAFELRKCDGIRLGWMTVAWRRLRNRRGRKLLFSAHRFLSVFAASASSVFTSCFTEHKLPGLNLPSQFCALESGPIFLFWNFRNTLIKNIVCYFISEHRHEQKAMYYIISLLIIINLFLYM